MKKPDSAQDTDLYRRNHSGELVCAVAVERIISLLACEDEEHFRQLPGWIQTRLSRGTLGVIPPSRMVIIDGTHMRYANEDEWLILDSDGNISHVPDALFTIQFTKHYPLYA